MARSLGLKGQDNNKVKSRFVDVKKEDAVQVQWQIQIYTPDIKSTLKTQAFKDALDKELTYVSCINQFLGLTSNIF